MKRRRGYTLVELLVVAVLAVALLGLSAAGYHTWVRTTAADASATRLRAELVRARAYALARACPTRVSIYPGDRGDSLLTERRDAETGDDWIPIARTNRLSWVHVSPTRFYFRADGSCCTNADLLAEEASFDDFEVVLSGPARTAAAQGEAEESLRFHISSRTGLAGEGDER